jgi:hypothetical protein
MQRIVNKRLLTLLTAGLLLFLVGLSIVHQHGTTKAVREPQTLVVAPSPSQPDGPDSYPAPVEYTTPENGVTGDTVTSKSPPVITVVETEPFVVEAPDFSLAFAYARSRLGPGRTFTWQGREYTTAYREEVDTRPEVADRDSLPAAPAESSLAFQPGSDTGTAATLPWVSTEEE